MKISTGRRWPAFAAMEERVKTMDAGSLLDKEIQKLDHYKQVNQPPARAQRCTEFTLRADDCERRAPAAPLFALFTLPLRFHAKLLSGAIARRRAGTACCDIAGLPPGYSAMKRKIAAIFAADVAGYSRLVAEDEEETLRRLQAYRAVM